ncbi:MAG: transferase, partial [Desulfobacteraceae bacterium]
GFNSFLHGTPRSPLTIGGNSVVMPHTIIDARTPLTIPDGQLVWGLITDEEELAANSIPLDEFYKINGAFNRGGMYFEGRGAAFVEAFRHRIDHILEANGAFFDGTYRGHAQKNQNISFNTIQPYPEGDLEGLYPTILIRP